MSWQSGQTSTNSTPSGENLTAYSPWSNVRSQTAQARMTVAFVTRMAATLAGLGSYPQLRVDTATTRHSCVAAAPARACVSSITFCATCAGTSS